jgi:hypothetical protein
MVIEQLSREFFDAQIKNAMTIAIMESGFVQQKARAKR